MIGQFFIRIFFQVYVIHFWHYHFSYSLYSGRLTHIEKHRTQSHLFDHRGLRRLGRRVRLVLQMRRELSITVNRNQNQFFTAHEKQLRQAPYFLSLMMSRKCTVTYATVQKPQYSTICALQVTGSPLSSKHPTKSFAHVHARFILRALMMCPYRPVHLL